jgi:secreted effector protein SseB
VKAALESDSGRSSDFVQQGQLQIQQILQTFNIATQMANSLQSMGAEMNKGIASSIR